MKRRASVLAILLLAGLVLSACSTNTGAPSAPVETPTDEPEEAMRDVYAMTVGNGIVGQAITTRNIKMASAVTEQDTEKIELSTETSMIYINADQAELEALKESDFLKEAVDKSVPVLIESEAADKLAEVTSDLFGFSLSDNAILVAKDESGAYSAVPMEKENAAEAVLDDSLPQSTSFRDVAEPAKVDTAGDESGDAASDEASELTSQQFPSPKGKGNETWVWSPATGDPTAKVTNRSGKKRVYIWEGTPAEGCAPNNSENCNFTFTEGESISHTWEVSVGVDGSTGSELTQIGFNASTSFSQTVQTSWTQSNRVTVKPGQAAKPRIYQEIRDVSGRFQGDADCTPPFKGTCNDLAKSGGIFTINGSNYESWGATYEAEVPTRADQIRQWYIYDQ